MAQLSSMQVWSLTFHLMNLTWLCCWLCTGDPLGCRATVHRFPLSYSCCRLKKCSLKDRPPEPPAETDYELCNYSVIVCGCLRLWALICSAWVRMYFLSVSGDLLKGGSSIVSFGQFPKKLSALWLYSECPDMIRIARQLSNASCRQTKERLKCSDSI